MSDLKNLITEPFISIRKMYHQSYEVPNFASFIFASNQPDPVTLDPNDRRFNFGNYQEHQLEITAAEIVQLEEEIQPFVDYMMSREADLERAYTVLKTAEREYRIQTSMTSLDLVAGAILEGDFAALWDSLPVDPMLGEVNKTGLRGELMKRVLEPVLLEDLTKSKLSRDDLFTIFDYTVGNMPTSPHKFTSLLRHHRIQTQRLRIGENLVYGIAVEWKIDPEWREQAKAKLLAEKKPRLKR
jgi:hypothetical protein